MDMSYEAGTQPKMCAQMTNFHVENHGASLKKSLCLLPICFTYVHLMMKELPYLVLQLMLG